jgi:hypothetical protein
MKRWALLVVCIGAVAMIGGAPIRAERGRIGLEVSGLAGQAAADSDPCASQETRTLRLPSEGWIVVDAAPRMPCCLPDVRGFHPYPECEIVGMPFAGVKMCE